MIQEEIWGSEVFVDFDRGLNVCIAQIRSALNDDSEAPRFIQTVPRRGYKFVAPVEQMPTALPAPVPCKLMIGRSPQPGAGARCSSAASLPCWSAPGSPPGYGVLVR